MDVVLVAHIMALVIVGVITLVGAAIAGKGFMEIRNLRWSGNPLADMSDAGPYDEQYDQKIGALSVHGFGMGLLQFGLIVGAIILFSLYREINFNGGLY